MNKVQAAKCFNVSTNTITDWVRKGCPFEKQGRNGDQYIFDLPAVISWRVEQLVAQAMGMFKVGDDINTALRREAFAKAELRELELAEKRKELINVKAAVKIVERGIMDTRSLLLAMPTKLAPQLIVHRTPAPMKHAIEKAIRDALNGLTRIKFSEDVLEGDLEPLGSAADSNDQRVGGPVSPAQPRKQRRARAVGDIPGGVSAGDHGRRVRSYRRNRRGNGQLADGKDRSDQ